MLARKDELSRLILGNDIWMVAHVLLVLCCSPALPKNQDPHRCTERLYPGQGQSAEAEAPDGGGGGIFDRYVAQKADLQVRLSADPVLRELLAAMYAPLKDRISAEQVLAHPWLQDAPKAGQLGAMLAPYFRAKEGGGGGGGGGKDFLPDLDLIDTAVHDRVGRGNLGPDGLLVCRVGSRAAGVQEGDVVTHADGLPLALEAKDLRDLRERANFDGLTPATLRRWGQRLQEGGSPKAAEVASKLAEELETRGEEQAEVEDCLARVSDQLWRGLEGEFGSAVELVIWRPTPEEDRGEGAGKGAKAYERLAGTVECRRVRDPKRRAASNTPERSAPPPPPTLLFRPSPLAHYSSHVFSLTQFTHTPERSAPSSPFSQDRGPRLPSVIGTSG